MNEELIVSWLSLIAFVFGVLWTTTNIYQYSPVLISKAEDIFPTNDSKITYISSHECIHDAVKNLDGPSSDNIPTIDVFVPAYMEESIIHQSIKSINECTYPREALNLHIILEPDDEKTKEVVSSLESDYSFSQIIVPSSYPGVPNKPRALNYAFEHTTGDIIGILDAENIVEPDLFDQVASSFLVDDIDYVQGIVDMANESDGWLNLLFRAEYGFWYRIIVPSFYRLNFPIPLSGTTCFFRRNVLEQVSDIRYERTGAPWGDKPTAEKEAHISEQPQKVTPDGGENVVGKSKEKTWLKNSGLTGFIPWDPTNVTEDFELGLLLSATGFKMGIINSTTREESPRTASTWLKQRTRWQKGKIYTLQTFLQNPATDVHKQLHILWQSFLPHLGVLNISGALLLIFIGSFIGFTPKNIIVSSVLTIALLFLPISMFAFVVGYWLASTASLEKRIARTAIVFFTLPLYWVLQWIADVRATKQFLSGNLDWEKTLHENANKFDELHQLNTDSDRSLFDYLWTRLTGNLLIYPILALACVLRIPGIRRTMWIDEAYSVIVRSSQPILGTIITQEPHPPLYYLLLNGWMWIFGKSEIATRSLSVVIGVGIVAGAYLFAARLYDENTGLVMALLMAISTLQIQYSQTVRMYGLMTFFGLLSLYFYIRLLESQSMENRFAYSFSVILLLYTHIYGVFIVVAQILHLALLTVQHRDSIYGPGLTVVKSASVAGLIFSPWVLGMLIPNYILSSSETIGWLQKPNIVELKDILYSFANRPVAYPILRFEGYSTDSANILIGVFTVALFYLLIRYVVLRWSSAGSINHLRRSNSQLSDRSKSLNATFLGFTVIISSVVIPYILSHLLIPILEVRYAIIGYIGFALILSRAIMTLPRQTVRIIAVIGIVVLAAPGLVAYYETDPVEEWEGLSSSLNDKDLSNDLIIYEPDHTSLPVTYYLTSESTQEVTAVKHSNEAELRSKLSNQNFDRIWVVTYSNRPAKTDSMIPSSFEEVKKQKFGRGTESAELIKYERRVNTSQTPVSELPIGRDSVLKVYRSSPLTRIWPVPVRRYQQAIK